MRNLWLVLLLIGSALLPARRAAGAGTDVDDRWAQLANFYHAELQLGKGDANRRERVWREYRELGQAFYKNYPNDPRRWTWFIQTLGSPVRYFDGDLNVSEAEEASWLATAPARLQWETLYETEYKPAFLSSLEVTSKQRAEFFQIEAVRKGEAEQRKWERGEAIDVSGTFQMMLGYAAESAPEPNKGGLQFMCNRLFAFMAAAKMGEGAKREMFTAMSHSTNIEMQLLGAGKLQEMGLSESPLALQVPGFDGSIVDLAQFRGKPVLVDIWGPLCGVCIMRMPEVRKVYDKYRQQGFEVVGVCLLETRDEAAEKVKALGSLEKTGGIAWTNAFLSRDKVKGFSDKYSIVAVPVTWLLDKDGKLVTNDVEGPKLEAEVRRLLGLHASSQL